MKLFGEYEAVKFPQENLILITHRSFLYYIYDPKCNFWRKYPDAGNDCITVGNYPDVSKEELVAAMKGVFPEKETDFMRMCVPSRLSLWDMLALLKEEYTSYLSDRSIYYAIRRFLSAIHLSHGVYA